MKKMTGLSNKLFQKRLFTFLNLLVIFLFLLLIGEPRSVKAAPPGSPLAINDRLKVIGKQLTNQCGNPIQLRGMSSHGLQWYGWEGYANTRPCISQDSMGILLDNWDADIFRASLYPSSQAEGYVTDPTGFKQMMDLIVEEAYNHGIYVIIDWHVMEIADPWDVIDYAREFFGYMSAKHGNKGNVLYEICNEPDVSWSRIKSYAEDIIPRIRQNDPEGIIIVGTPDRSFDLDAPWSNRLTGNNAYNVMYSYHWYLYSHDEVERADNRGQPLFISEWAATNSRGENLSQSRGQAWIDLMKERGLSWTAWAYADSGGGCDVWRDGTCPNGPWTDVWLKEWGLMVKDWIKNPADNFPPCDGLTPTPVPPTSTPVPPTPTPNPYDLNGDGRVNASDVPVLLANYFSSLFLKADFNGDGLVNGLDFALLITQL